MPLARTATIVTGLGAVASAVLAETPVFPDALQYGALGLCGVMIVLNWFSTRSMAQRLDRDRTEIVELHKATLATLNRVCEGLEDRPCLIGDHRTKKP
jgi:hypothetical protein